MKYLVTGATGFFGTKLVKQLVSENNSVTVLVRNIDKAKSLFGESVQFAIWEDIYTPFKLRPQHFDVVINLMGENIADKKWTNERKKSLYNSRVDGSRNLYKFLDYQSVEYSKVVQISAIGIYNETKNVIFEDGDFANDFLGKLCQDWEKQVTDLGVKKDTVILRTGMVLGKNGGAMSKILPVFKLGLGGKLGHGTQYMSWIHIDDLVNLTIKASEDKSMLGVFNAVSSYPISNHEFTNVLSDLLRKPALLPVPRFALKLVLGEMSTVALSNLQVKSKKLKDVKFVFKYPTVETALKEVVSK